MDQGSGSECRRAHISEELRSSPEHQLARLFYDHRELGPEILSFVFLGLATPLSGLWQIVCLALSILLGTATVVIKAKEKTRISSLQQERDKLQQELAGAQVDWRSERNEWAGERDDLTTQIAAMKDSMVQLLDSSMESYAASLDLGGYERVSIYLHWPDSSIFQGIARHATNPAFDQFRREVYPDNQGCISDALRDGHCIERELSDP